MRFRSINSHHIKEEKHQHFLLEKRNDPVTGDCFLEGDEVVFCSSCKSAFLKDSWAYMGNKHCDQRSTLSIFPKMEKLTLRKPIQLPFVFANADNRSSAFFMDIFILTGIYVALFILTTKTHLTYNPYVSLFLGFLLFTFRDSILINKSIGKFFQQMYFIDVETNLPAKIWQTLGRNLLYWVMNGIFGILYLIIITLGNKFGTTEILVLFVGLTVAITNVFYIKYNIEKGYSWFDKLLGIRLVKKQKVMV